MLDLSTAVSLFAPIALREMDNVALQTRMDTKYLFGSGKLPLLLEELDREYRMLEVNGQRGITYRTLYFDTINRKHYFDHHNGRTLRSKVRMREYVGSTGCFLEVKRKNGRGGTEKRRIPIAAITGSLTPAQQTFVSQASHCNQPLIPMLQNEFLRYTLVHRERLERVTIDGSITFRDDQGEAALRGVCVAELKEGRTGHGSPFAALMRSMPVPQVNMSKYCVGTLLLQPQIKHNQFKPVMLHARRLASVA